MFKTERVILRVKIISMEINPFARGLVKNVT